MEKITKKQMFEGMIAYFEGADTELTEMQFVEFCKGQIADLDKKAAKAKERAAAKKAEGDELQELVESVLTEDLQTIADITTAVLQNLPEDADVSGAKVTARLKKLVDAGVAVKEQVTVEIDGKKSKKMAYAIAGVVAEEDAE